MKKPESEHKKLVSNWRLVEKHGLIIIRKRRQFALKRYNPAPLTTADFEKAQRSAEKQRKKNGEFTNSIKWKKGDE